MKLFHLVQIYALIQKGEFERLVSVICSLNLRDDLRESVELFTEAGQHIVDNPFTYDEILMNV